MPDETAIIAAKRRLREDAKARRALIATAERQEAAERISAIGIAFATDAAPRCVSGFLAIGEEINPVPLMARLAREGAQLALPVMIAKAAPLVFRAWQPGAPLVTRMWSIREPDDTSPEIEPDVLLVPLLAFDRIGRRLGYGGGFYDRTIRRLRLAKPVTTIGLAYAAQEVDAVPALDYDERLDWVLTPDGPIRCHV